MNSLTASPLSVAFGRGRIETILRRLRVGLIYYWRHGRWPNLDRPRRFTEWVQWRKLSDSADPLAILTDKLHSKGIAEDRCGPGMCVPTLWAGPTLPERPPGPYPLVVKANHGCRQTCIVRCPADWRTARRLSRRWMSRTYGAWLDERHYRAARRLLIVEPYIGSRETLPDDYKVYVFAGRAAVIQHHVARGTRSHRWTQFDRSWNWVGGAPSGASPPATLARMIDTAQRLASGADFLRVDFYEVERRLWFGEFCLFPGSGLDPFEPVELDLELGKLWSSARAD